MSDSGKKDPEGLSDEAPAGEELTDGDLAGVAGGAVDPSTTDWLADLLAEQFREQIKDLDPAFVELLKLALS